MSLDRKMIHFLKIAALSTLTLSCKCFQSKTYPILKNRDIRRVNNNKTHKFPFCIERISITSPIILRNQKRKDDSSYIESTKEIENNSSRRSFLSQMVNSSAQISVMSGSTFFLNTDPVNAGELGAKINAAVTQSDLGISVRRSVVRGAQVMDKLDGSWEKFSDNFGLGAERSKQGSRPKPKIIPDPLPLDIDIANALLLASDSVSEIMKNK